MSEITDQTILTIDTGANVFKEETIEPLPVYTDKHPMLSQRIPEYDVRNIGSPVLAKLIKRLKMTMKLHNGIGLSANQCGVFERVFVIGTEHFQIACINPEIIETSETTKKENEGCLSFPGLSVKVDRPEWIMARYINEEGKQVEVRMEGLTAKCYQHELDHMNGIKFTDHVGPVALQLAEQKRKKLLKKIQRLHNRL
jgi:peptide deformylase